MVWPVAGIGASPGSEVGLLGELEWIAVCVGQERLGLARQRRENGRKV